MMEESDSEDQNKVEMEEYKVQDGKRYHRLSGGSRPCLMFRKIPLSVLLLILILLHFLVIVLQVVTIASVNQSTPEVSTSSPSALPNTMLSSQMMNQLIESFNATCGSKDSTQSSNDSLLLNQLYDVTQSSAQKLHDIVRTLSTLEDSSTSSKGIVDDILIVAEELLKLQNKSLIFSSHVPVSCEDIKKYDPDSPSGYYHINSQLVYCEMGELCGSQGAWTRIGYLDMADSAQNCPANFRLYESNGVRGCGRPYGSSSGCASVKLSPNGISYSEVCGRVIGYQFNSPDAVDTRFVSESVHNDINQNYVDGVSITYGFPRQHIWTLMAGVFENYFDFGNCPCNSPNSSTQHIQSFVGDNYYCESGNPYHNFSQTIYANDPLWDGKGCGTQEQNCCANVDGDLPWFYRTISPTTDYIELRECGDEGIYNEDVFVNFFDIYIK